MVDNRKLATKSGQPSLAELTKRHVATRCQSTESETDTQVEPYEVVSGFMADLQTTWSEANLVNRSFGIVEKIPAPADWSSYVRRLSPTNYLTLNIGHFPQQVSDLGSLIAKTGKTTQAAQLKLNYPKNVTASTALGFITVAAISRLSGEYANAFQSLDEAAKLAVDEGTRLAIQNERAGTHLAKGETEVAVQLWSKMPVSNSVAQFNLGVISLSRGENAEAAEYFRSVTGQFPSQSGWSHLADLYLSLASI